IATPAPLRAGAPSGISCPTELACRGDTRTLMSYPYLSDLVNAVFGTSLHLPIPMFGTMVVVAIGAATMLVRREVERHEMSGSLPRSTSPIVADLSIVSVISGVVGARLFHILDHWSQFVADPASMIFARA